MTRSMSDSSLYTTAIRLPVDVVPKMIGLPVVFEFYNKDVFRSRAEGASHSLALRDVGGANIQGPWNPRLFSGRTET